jgi:cyclic-di-GMP phosphodiesterase TipF (flagellum assembly factor)
VQALVYALIAFSAVALGALAYFGLTFTPVNAILISVVFGCVCVVLMERVLRQRAEARLERAIQDLSRLLATDAQAGAVLGKRINALTDTNAGERLETVEADISVLGTVIRQVAEAVADIEEKVVRPASYQRETEIGTRPTPFRREEPAPAAELGPTIPVEMLRQALDERRLAFYIQPVVQLPHRRAVAYDLVPRLQMEDGDLASQADFMPRRGGLDLVARIEAAALVEAVSIARRSRTGGQPIILHVPLSRATLGDEIAAEQLLVTVDANRAIAPGLSFVVREAEWKLATQRERAVLDALARKGASFSMADMGSLRHDIAELAAQGVRSMRVDAAMFIETPEVYTDFHSADIAGYLARFEVTLLAMGISGERQIIELLDDGIVLVCGDYIAAPGPVRPDLVLESPRASAQPLRRAEL